jgi:hypothetical protein
VPAQLDTIAPPHWNWQESKDALWAYGVFSGVLLLGSLPGVAGQRWADLPYFMTLAVMTIYIGAHRSLTPPFRQNITLKQV